MSAPPSTPTRKKDHVILSLSAKKISLLLTILLTGWWFFSILAKLSLYTNTFGHSPIPLGSFNPLPLLEFAEVGTFGIAVALMTAMCYLLEPAYRHKALQVPYPYEGLTSKLFRCTVIGGGIGFSLNLLVNADFSSFFWMTGAPWLAAICAAGLSAWRNGCRLVEAP